MVEEFGGRGVMVGNAVIACVGGDEVENGCLVG